MGWSPQLALLSTVVLLLSTHLISTEARGKGYVVEPLGAALPIPYTQSSDTDYYVDYSDYDEYYSDKDKTNVDKKGANNIQGALYDPADAVIPDSDKDKTNLIKSFDSYSIKDKTGMVKSLVSDTIKDKTGMVKSLDSDTIKGKTGIIKSLVSDTIKDKTGMVKSLDSDSIKDKTGMVKRLDSDSIKDKTGMVKSLVSTTIKDKTGIVKSLDSDTIKEKTGIVKSLDSDTIKDKTGMVKSLVSDTIKDKTGMIKSSDSDTIKTKTDENKAQKINGGTKSEIFYSIGITEYFLSCFRSYLYNCQKLDEDEMTYMETITDNSMQSMKRIVQLRNSSEYICKALKTKYISDIAKMLVNRQEIGSLIQKTSTIIDAFKQAFLKTTGVIDKKFLIELLETVKLLLQMKANKSNSYKGPSKYGGLDAGATAAENGGAVGVSGAAIATGTGGAEDYDKSLENAAAVAAAAAASTASASGSERKAAVDADPGTVARVGRAGRKSRGQAYDVRKVFSVGAAAGVPSGGYRQNQIYRAGTSDGTIDYLYSNSISKLLKYIAKENPDLCKIEILMGILKAAVSQLNKQVPALDLSKCSK